MSKVSIDIKNLPLSDQIDDADLIVLEKANFTASAPATLLKDYAVKEIVNIITEKTYTADERTITLSAGQFKVKDGGISESQLSSSVLSKLGGATTTVTGNITTYTDKITADGEYLEMFIVPSPGAVPVKYAIRVYKVL